MLNNIENTFRDIISAVQIARLYPEWHPQFKKSIDKAYISLQDVLSDKDKLVLGIVGEELAFEKAIFFDLSKTVRQMILYLKERGIERIEFIRGLESEELSKFISFLVMSKDEIKGDSGGYFSSLGIRNIIVGKIKVLASESDASLEDKMKNSLNYLKVYNSSLDDVTNSVEKVLNAQDLDHLVLRQTIFNVLESLTGRYQDFLNFAAMKRFDVKTFFHILNVSVLSMYFSTKIGFSKDQVLDIGTAALFHDIGKIYISRKIIQKPAKLTDEEFAKIKSHVVVGAEILLKYVDTLGILPVVICFEHHLKYDLTGYPKVSYYRKPHIASLIVAICDVYDALAQRRGYKNDYPPQMIYEIMMKDKGQAFEAQLLDKFFMIVGVWPVGTIVKLTDGSVAVVREENEDDIFSPNVEVIAPSRREELIDLKTLKGTIKIERSLNPFNEGKDYFHLIYPQPGNNLTSD
jgi:putative nucleotidyltransferase with HDIG domain